MKKPDYVYVTYIAATPERVWAAMIEPAFTRQFFGLTIDGEWKAGATFRAFLPDGRLEHEAHVLEYDPPRRVSLTWISALIDGALWTCPKSVATVVVEPLGDVVRVTATETHEDPVDESYLDGARIGWPMAMSRLKTLVETGRPLPRFKA